jgi:hypothetical protein
VTPPSNSGPMNITDSGRQISPIFASPSVSETLSSTPAAQQGDTDMASVNGAARGRTYVWGGVAVAVALGVGLIAVLSSGKPPAPADTPQTSATAPQPPPVTDAPAPTPSTSATAPGPVMPFIRQVRIDSDPQGASVSENGTELCTATPCELTWKDDAARADHKLALTKKGWKTTKVTVGTSDEKLKATLDIIPMSAPVQPQPVVAPPASGRPLYKKDF